MQTIRISYLLFLLLSLFIAVGCNNDNNLGNDLDNNGQDDYSEFCGDLSGGNFNVSIDGSDWSTNCLQAVYSESITANYEQKLLYIYAYNHAFTYFTDTDIEVAVVIWIETTIDGETTTAKSAAFYNGFYDYSQAINNPDYELEEFSAYLSNEDSIDDIFNITGITSDEVSGNMSFKLFEEETNEEVTMSGSFTANIVQ